MKKPSLFLVLLAAFCLISNAQQVIPQHFPKGMKVSKDQVQHLKKNQKSVDLGWIFPTNDIYNNINGGTGATYYANILFPDSTVTINIGATLGDTNNWTMAIGQVFDPYSKIFDPAFNNTLIVPNTAYYIDSIAIMGWYMKKLPQIDTLIIEITQGLPATNDSYLSYYEYSPPLDTMYYYSPKMYGDPAQFGYKAKLTDPNKTIIKYPLTLFDTTLHYGKYITIPIGISIPANHITGVSISYVPGFNYNLNDTIITYYPSTSQIFSTNLNAFVFAWYYENFNPFYNIFYDPAGKNLSYMITTQGRYSSYTGASSSILNNSMKPLPNAGIDIGWKIIADSAINIPICSSQFYMYPDTNIAHHYFIVNQASGVAPIHYHWDWNDGTYDTIPYPSHTYNSAGSYSICLDIVTGDSCIVSYCDMYDVQKNTNTIISVDVIPQTPIGIKEIIPIPITISPNPSHDYLNITNLSPNTKARIYDFTGKTLLMQDFNSSQAQVDISKLASGMYLIELSNSAGRTVKKFLKE